MKIVGRINMLFNPNFPINNALENLLGGITS